MSYAIKLTATGTFQIVEIPENRDWRWPSQQIGCDLIDIVRTDGLGHEFVMIVDDEGLLKEDPMINMIASVLYGFKKHGEFLVGDVLIMREDEEDLAGLDSDQIDEVFLKIAEMMG